MAGNNVLRWPDGQGWLILSGGNDGQSEVRAQTLERAAADGGVVYLSLGSLESAESALEDMEDLGAGAGYLVDLLVEDDETIKGRVGEAGIIVIQGGHDAEGVRSSLLGAAIEGIRAAFERGAFVLAEGVCAAAFGDWIIRASGEAAPGLGWLEYGLIVPGVTAVAASSEAQTLFRQQAAAIAVGIGIGSALALGPNGEVELWGRRQVTVALGTAFSGG